MPPTVPTPGPLPTDAYVCPCGSPFIPGRSLYVPRPGNFGPCYLRSGVRVLACTGCRHHFALDAGRFRDLSPAEAAEYAARPDFRGRLERSVRLAHEAGCWG